MHQCEASLCDGSFRVISKNVALQGFSEPGLCFSVGHVAECQAVLKGKEAASEAGAV